MEQLQDLTDPESFGVKVIDLGYARRFNDNSANESRPKILNCSSSFGSAMVSPPEAKLGGKFDDRMDTWYLGISFLVLLSFHKDIVHHDKEHWSIYD